MGGGGLTPSSLNTYKKGGFTMQRHAQIKDYEKNVKAWGHLMSTKQKLYISQYLGQGLDQPTIAVLNGKHKSTISRVIDNGLKKVLQYPV